jgi:DNA polymerase phi
MADKIRKRGHDSAQGEHKDEAPVKRRRQVNEEQLKLSKLYEDLTAESDDVRFEAAKQLIVKFSPESNPTGKDVQVALVRLIKGLCSQRKAARVGFSLTLTELLREIFGQKETLIEGLDLDVASLIQLVEDKTKVEGNVPGRVSPSSDLKHILWLTILRSGEIISSEGFSATRLFCSLRL